MIFSYDVHKLTRISKVCSTYELTKQFMEICVKNCASYLKKNNLYKWTELNGSEGQNIFCDISLNENSCFVNRILHFSNIVWPNYPIIIPTENLFPKN